MDLEDRRSTGGHRLARSFLLTNFIRPFGRHGNISIEFRFDVESRCWTKGMMLYK